MSLARVQEVMRVHRLAGLRGASVTPSKDGWSLRVAGQEFAVANLPEAERVLLSLPLATPGGIFRQPSEATR